MTVFGSTTPQTRDSAGNFGAEVVAFCLPTKPDSFAGKAEAQAWGSSLQAVTSQRASTRIILLAASRLYLPFVQILSSQQMTAS